MNKVDALTGLLDRFGCLQKAAQLAADPVNCDHPLAVIWVNIARFKQINESFGHRRGDELIKDLAMRFRFQAGGRADISRMGSDEFVFLVSMQERSQVVQLARELANTVKAQINIENMVLRPTASIGIAFLVSGDDSLELLEAAERAMFAAKNNGGNCIVCSDDAQLPGNPAIILAREELMIESKLHASLEIGGLSLHYQPIIQANGHIEAVEALMRCTIEGESILPDKFIPVAERTGLITRIGEWSLLQGAMYARQLQDAGYNTSVAINVSRAQLVSPKFAQALHAALICSNVKPELVELELTESLFMDTSETVQNNLKNAIAVGVGLSIDDFGTGYSCLANLKDIPAKKLKLDRAFVTVLPADRRAMSVVRSMTQLGHELGMSIVAEGCETQEQIDALFDVGVDAIQGFFYARPMPQEEMLAWLYKRKIL